MILNGTGLLIDHAKSAEAVTVTGRKRDSGIKAKAELSRNQRICQGPRVYAGIFDEIGCIFHDRGGTQARLSVDLLHMDAMMRLEPNAIFIDDTDD